MKPAVLAALAALGGCAAVGPNHEAPSLTTVGVPAQWVSLQLGSAPDTDSTHSPWWRELQDEALNHLAEAALASSPTLEAAQARLAQAVAAREQTLAYGYPAATLRVADSRAATDAKGDIREQASLSLDASWEIDFFGAVRRGREGAAAREHVQEATLADTQVNLLAELVDSFVAYRACQAARKLNEQDLASRQATARLTAASVEAGVTAPYQGARSAASVVEAKTQRAALASQCSQLENQLVRISGLPRPELAILLARASGALRSVPSLRRLDLYIPAESVARRPDIRAAERSLAAASADIGLAVADQFPRLSLVGTVGYTAQDAGPGSVSFGLWSFGPSLTLPVLDGGRRAAAVRVARARYDEALALYKARARQAVREIEDGLTRYAAATERLTTAQEASRHYESYFRTVTLRYQEGASSLLELEDARRVWLFAEQTLLSVRQEQLQSWAYLHRATGGGAQYSQPDAGQPNA